MIVKNRLLNFGNNVIYQDDNYFNFSLDSVLLSNFVDVDKFNNKEIRILDMCTGNAPVCMLLSFKTKSSIVGVEIQKEIYDLGCMSVKENNMDNQIRLINDDIKNIGNYYQKEYFDIITCNPPYFKVDKESNLNNNDIKSIARHELKIKLEDIFSIACKYLKNKGIFYLVHRPERLSEIFYLMKKYKLEPKKIRNVFPKDNTNSNMILIEAVKNGNVGLKIMYPLIAHDKEGNYSKEIKEMFGDENVAN